MLEHCPADPAAFEIGPDRNRHFRIAGLFVGGDHRGGSKPVSFGFEGEEIFGRGVIDVDKLVDQSRSNRLEGTQKSEAKIFRRDLTKEVADNFLVLW
jgi:hypothetical protein